MSNLLPCPFCGNPTPRQPVSILGRWLVECGVPCGGAVRDYATSRDATMAWNRRPGLTSEALTAAYIKADASGRQLLREAAPDPDAMKQPCTI